MTRCVALHTTTHYSLGSGGGKFQITKRHDMGLFRAAAAGELMEAAAADVVVTTLILPTMHC